MTLLSRSRRPPRSAARLLVAAALCALAITGCAGAGAGETPGPPGAPALRVERGTLQPRLLLTGELRAERAKDVVVPRSPSWQVQIRWMEEDGARVHTGQKVLELENDQFASELEEKKLAAAESSQSLARRRAQAGLDEAEKEFAVRERQADLEKARIAAAVPESLLPAREYQERQLARRKAEVELAKAREDVEATRRSGAAEIEIERIALERAQREIATAERALEDLSLEAPGDGILVVEEHPWEGRKLQAGDNVWVGLTVLRIPDLSSMAVEAELPDVDDGQIAPGMAAAITLDAFPDLRLGGRVLEVSPVARGDGRSLRRFFTVRVSLEGADPERLRPGMSVKVEVLGEPVEGALLAPRAALDLTAEPPRAQRADGDLVEVRLGPCDAMRCAVEGGLTAGDRLAVWGAS